MKKLWNKLMQSELLPLTFGILIITSAVAGLGFMTVFFIKCILIMLGVN